MLKPSPDDLLKSAIRSILKNKGRTILTSLGIIIGVTSVILLTSIGTGLKFYINDQFDKLGSNLIYVAPGKLFSDQGGFNSQEAMPSTTFDQKDYKNLRRNLRNSIVIPSNETSLEIKYGNTKKRSVLIGTSEDWGKYRNMLPSEGNGRWFSAEDNQKGSNVAVLGYNIASDLFGIRDPLGKKITAGGRNLTVIGIIDKKGSNFGGPDLDSYVYIPLSTYESITGKNDISSFNIRVPSPDLIESSKKEIENILLEHYEEDDFTVFDSAQLLSSINSIISILTVALTGIAAISLVVGGIGIMNIMLVTVSERTREIGLRKAIGAYPRAILLQFLIEAVILSGFGGIIGILLGYLGTLAINNFFPAKLTLGSVLLAFGVSSIVGIIFGVAPARKASKLSPIEALRYE